MTAAEIIKLQDERVLWDLLVKLKKRGDFCAKIGNEKRANRYFRLCANTATRWERLTGRRIEWVRKSG